MTLDEAFREVTAKHAQKTALFWGDEVFSYHQLHAQSLWVAEVLRTKLGVKPGDRVALWSKNCPQFVPALFGIWSAGAVAVPINN
ncbi:MAG: AMP-binding protein, partial [Limisphaerales bacterium]